MAPSGAIRRIGPHRGPFLLLASILFLVWPPFYLAWTLFLYFAVWTAWLPHGKRVLFVTSDSPVWQEYLNRGVLAKIRGQTIVLNWSQRNERPLVSLRKAVFHHFGGRREFNSMAVVFLPFRRAKIFRYYEPFRAYKHGRPEAVKKLTSDLLSRCGIDDRTMS